MNPINSRDHYFVRIDGWGNPIPASGIFRRRKPSTGSWVDVTLAAKLCCNYTGELTANDTDLTITTETTTGNIITLSGASSDIQSPIHTITQDTTIDSIELEVNADGSYTITLLEDASSHEGAFTVVFFDEAGNQTDIAFTITFTVTP